MPEFIRNILQQPGQELPELSPEVISTIDVGLGEIAITNTLTSGLVVTLIIVFIIILFNLFYKPRGVPSKFQIALERVYKVLLEFINNTTNSKKLSAQIFPLIAGIFIYFSVANIIPTLPFMSGIQVNGTELFRTHTTDLSVTLGLAGAVVLGTHILDVRKRGIAGHVNKYIHVENFAGVLKDLKPSNFQLGAFFLDGLTYVIETFVSILDFISDFFRAFSLGLRLYVNIFVGEVLLVILLGIVAIILPSILLIYGIAVGLLQAVIFAALSASYYAIAVASEEEMPERRQLAAD